MCYVKYTVAAFCCLMASDRHFHAIISIVLYVHLNSSCRFAIHLGSAVALCRWCLYGLVMHIPLMESTNAGAAAGSSITYRLNF